MRSAICGLVLFVLGCSESTTYFVSQDDFGADYGFLLALDATGSVLETQGPISLIDEAADHFVLPDGDLDSLLFIGWHEAELLEASPAFDATRATSMRLVTGRTTCDPGFVSNDGSRIQIAIPEETTRLSFKEGRGWQPVEATEALTKSVGELSLDLPADTTRCLGEQEPAFSPFGGLDPVIGPDTIVGGQPFLEEGLRIREIYRLPDDRLVAISFSTILSIERGRPFEDLPRHAIQLVDPNGPFSLRGLAVDPDPRRGEGRLRVFVSASFRAEADPNDEGYLFELRLGDDGFEQVGTATRTDRPISSVVVRPEDGRLVAGATPSQIYTMLPGGPLENIHLPVAGEKSVDVYLTGLSETPYAIGGAAAGALFLGDSSAQTWEPERRLRDGSAFRSFAVRPTESGPQLWVGDTEGNVFQKQPDGSWTDATPKLGPEFATCFLHEAICGWSRPIETASGIIPLDDEEPGRVLLLVDGCVAVIALRTDLRCSVLVPVGDRPLAVLAKSIHFSSYHSNDRWITIASREGSIYEMPRQSN